MNNSYDISGEPDDVLQKLYVNGNEHALTVLSQRYGPIMLKYAMGILQNRMDAQEIVQDVLIKLSKSLYHEQLKSIPAWLHTGVMRKAIDKLRARKRDKIGVVELLDMKSEAAFNSYESEQRMALYEKFFLETLRSLDKNKVFVLIGRLLKDESNQQLALKLGLTCSDVNQLYYTGIRTVRRRMLERLNSQPTTRN